MINFVDTPSGDIVYGACDSLYWNDHVPPLLASCNKVGNDLHIHVVNPVEHVFEDYSNLKRQVGVNFTMSYESTDLNLVDTRTYYACSRFMVADKILSKVNSMLVTDVDALVMKKLEFPEAKLGLFLRDSLPGTVGWEQQGTKVAAGIVYLTQDSYNFISGVNKKIKSYGLRWFVDQVALYEQYIEEGWDKRSDFIDFGADVMDWQFLPDSYIWTGKGERKYNNTTYVNKKIEFHKCFQL